ncbi:uncharacterized protein LAESUDRAFT_729619 [Laetiporus sulphureus 93-53]|uniref:Uncharacterized protein n=1 Tax=Laetiporus sulphureus 93-53 TaxID=1314785 RepID=A0A165CN01_9APHY|nr:uncharacterized protein LAESUDRAFT_729619 [Laetiporus sulphureus 93-53]KZT03106.1 hypothetical protein LAESUDRAFT_729619 [Laetiporus sulphureus 93-53]
MCALIQARRWILIPTRSAIDSIYEMSEHNYSCGIDDRRSSYPLYDGKLYEYELVPTGLDVPLYSHKLDLPCHNVPYDDFPHVLSHAHPYFVILHFTHVVTSTFPSIPLPHQIEDEVAENLASIATTWEIAAPAPFLAPCMPQHSQSEASLDEAIRDESGSYMAWHTQINLPSDISSACLDVACIPIAPVSIPA